MAELGARLKQARQQRGVSLRDIAAETKHSVVTLEALEKGDYSRLPRGIFGRAFVRSYALAVSLDPEEAVNEFIAELARYDKDLEGRAIRREITPDDREFLERQKRALRTLRIVLALIVVGIAGGIAYVVWR